MSSLLKQTLAASYVPATNLKRQFQRAGWLYLLPSLDLGEILCIGVPTRGALATYARRARKVSVACLTGRDSRQRDRAAGTPDIERVEWLDGRDARVLSESLDRANLVILIGRWGRRWLAENRGGADALRGTLVRRASAYFEWAGLWTAAPDGSGNLAEVQRLGEVRLFRLLPLQGEAQVAVPEGDRETLEFFLRSGVVHPWLSPGLPRPVTKLLRRLPAAPVLGRRYGVLVDGPASGAAGRPPEYLCAIAGSHGVALEDYRWGLSVPSAYHSRKITFYLFGPHPARPSHLAKIVSEPSFNDRLENEARALRRLEVLGMADGERVPRVTFSGQHAGLTVVGETLIDGVPFRRRSEGGPTCPHAGAALDFLLELGRITSQAGAVTGPEVASAMGRLLSLFDGIYGDSEAAAFLQQKVERLRNHPDPIPLAFQHGDPGTWNLLVTATGQVAFLDWEAADEAGLPLWDLYYFLRSYGVLSARRRGVRSQVKAFEQAFLGDSELARWVRSAIAGYCQTVGVARSLVEPLFYLCWMHRSLKEATRLERRELNRGHYVALLRLCMRESESVGRLVAL